MSNPQRRRLNPLGIVIIPLLPIVVPIAIISTYIEVGYEKITGREAPIRKHQRNYNNPEGKPRKFRHIAIKHSKKKEAPEPLPARRKRALTLPLPDCASSKNPQETSLQEDSLFFTKLPLEIRRKIYGYILTDDQKVLQIYRKEDRRLSHFICDYKHQDCKEQNKISFTNSITHWYYDDEPFYTATGAVKTTAEFKNRAHHLIPLLQTSRRVYVPLSSRPE